MATKLMAAVSPRRVLHWLPLLAMEGPVLPSATCTATGKVFTPEGLAMAGVTIFIENEVNHVVTTNSEGVFIKTGLSCRLTKVTPSKSGFGFTPLSRNVNIDFEGFVEFRGVPLFSLSGKVVDDEGRGVNAVPIGFHQAEGNGYAPGVVPIYHVLTNTSGVWTKGGFFTGRPYLVQSPWATGYTLTPASRGPFTSANTDVNFVMSFAVSGRVDQAVSVHGGGTVNRAANGLELTFTKVSGSGSVPGPVRTGPSGTWTQSGFSPNATYRVAPTSPFNNAKPAYRDFSAPAVKLDFVLPVVTRRGPE
ncbi:MAG: hypothetical protein ACKVZ0_19805 [Gemmatimonadales bacterium]